MLPGFCCIHMQSLNQTDTNPAPSTAYSKQPLRRQGYFTTGSVTTEPAHTRCVALR